MSISIITTVLHSIFLPNVLFILYNFTSGGHTVKVSHCYRVYIPRKNLQKNRECVKYMVRQKNLTIFELQQNEKYTTFLREFITKIIFIWKHFNYNIHFLNIVSVRWRPLLSANSHKRRTYGKSLMQSFEVLRSSKWRLSSWTFSFCGRHCFSEVSHPQQYSIATRDTVVPKNIEMPMKYPLSHNDRIVVLEIRLHSESPMLYRPELNGNWNALSLDRRALKDKFPTPTIPLTAVLPNCQVFLPYPVCITSRRIKYHINRYFMRSNRKLKTIFT